MTINRAVSMAVLAVVLGLAMTVSISPSAYAASPSTSAEARDARVRPGHSRALPHRTTCRWQNAWVRERGRWVKRPVQRCAPRR